MGSVLPKPVAATVTERYGTEKFEVAVAEMNGWRTSMEDAHLIFTKDDYGVFGVFDGHGGGECSEFIAKRFKEELKKGGCPADDAAMKKMFLSIDQEFLDSGQSSGSTATMCIVRKPEKAGGTHRLHVINAGDSRVLLGRRDGSIVDGGGTDEGLTTDHKPDYPSERERIYRCGGRVETAEGGVARVNGNLAVSRGFGDKDEKRTGGPSLEERPVTADPEMGHFECDEGDFLLLVCDGVSEGQFPNPEVVQFVAQQLQEGAGLAAAAEGVCHRAVEMDSKDNITCMIVALTGPDTPIQQAVTFIPGPVSNLGHKGFRTAYEAMCKKAGLTLAQAVAKRYQQLQKEAHPSDEDQDELQKFSGCDGTDEWFETWLQELPEEERTGPGGLDMESLQEMLGKGSGLGGLGGSSKGAGKSGYSGKSRGSAGGTGGTTTDDAYEEHDEDGYKWLQNGEEVQVVFKLPQVALKSDVKVGFKPSSLAVSVHGKSLLDGALSGKVETEECTWCLASGGLELQVMLTKRDEKEVWKQLLK